MSTPTAERTYLERPPRQKPTAKRSVAAILAAAVIASGAVTGLLYAVGVAGGSTATLVARSSQTSGGPSAGAALNPSSLYQSAAPGVVAIEATGASSGSNGLPYTPPGQSIDTGTGIVIDAQGDILTASHVVAGASTITVKFQGGTVRSANVLGTDTSNDVSLLHVTPSGVTLHPLVLGSTASLSRWR